MHLQALQSDSPTHAGTHVRLFRGLFVALDSGEKDVAHDDHP